MNLASTTEIVIAAVATALATAAVAALTFLFRALARRRATTTGVIELSIPQEWAADARLRFGLRHVRDGKDEATGQGPLVNRTTWFRRANSIRAPVRALSEQSQDQELLTASIRYAKTLGVQFKCFVDFTEMTYEEVLTLFGEHAATTLADTAPEANNPQRAWLLLTSYPIVETRDGFRNNFLYPK